MKKRFSYLLGIGAVFSVGIIAGLSPALALYTRDANSTSFEITKENTIIEYKLEITNDAKTASKEIYSYIYDSTATTDATFTTTTLGSTFALTNSGGTYVPSGWTQKNIYVKKNTRFVWKKYTNSVPTELGTEIIGDEGLYSITPTYDGDEVSLGTVQLQKAIYLHTNSNWEQASAWFAIYLFGSDNFWMCANKQADHYYRFFIDNAKLGTYKCIFVRKNPANTTLSTWDNKWTQVPKDGGYVIGGDYGNNCFSISDWETGSWEDYSNE